MRIASVSLVKNEADILECFVRHNIAFVDKMFIIDDRSSDNTPKILELLQAEFANLEVVDDNWGGGFYQGPRTTQLMHHALREEAWDIVTALDADEFICATSRAEYEEDLRAIPDGMAGGYFEICYVLSADDDPAQVDPLKRLHTHIERNGRGAFKALVTKALCQHGEVVYDNGNHGVRIDGSPISVWPLPRVRLAHFPIRSLEHAILKSLTHYVTWKSCHSYLPGIASHLVRSVDILKNETSFTVQQREELISIYLPELEKRVRVERPFVERRGEMKWPELARQHPFAQLTALFDDLIERAAVGDRLMLAGGDETSDAGRLRALVEERNGMEKELTRFNKSTSKLLSTFAKVMRQKLSRSLRKRHLDALAYLSRRRSPSGKRD